MNIREFMGICGDQIIEIADKTGEIRTVDEFEGMIAKLNEVLVLHGFRIRKYDSKAIMAASLAAEQKHIEKVIRHNREEAKNLATYEGYTPQGDRRCRS